jgi:glycosyltransferase involved in cell wall biosynthesis
VLRAYDRWGGDGAEGAELGGPGLAALRPTGMIILHVLAAGEVGGLERVVRTLATGQRRATHRVAVAVVVDPSRAGHPFVRSLDGRDLEIVPIEVASRSYLAERAAIADLCRRLRPDVVHTHGYRADVLDSGVARREGIATVTTVHGFTGGGWRNRLYERLQRRAFRRFDAVVAVSQPLGEALVRDGVRRDRLHVIRNAWDGAVASLDRAAARRALGVPDAGFRIGWVGRMSHEKGPDVMLEALALLGDAAVSLSMLGDGEERTELRARGETLGVAARTTWHGTVADAAPLFPGFDVFALSSRTEGTPIVLFEAMAAGVPIVATTVGGVPGVLSPAEAVLVPPDDPASLAAAIRHTLHDPAAAQHRARVARQRLEREFGAQPWLERYDAVYRAVQQRRATAVAR